MSIERIQDTSAAEWLDTLPMFQRVPIMDLLEKGAGLEELSTILLSSPKIDNNAPFGGMGILKNYAEEFRKEFGRFVCGDEFYADLRSQVSTSWEKGRTPVLVAISGVIGAQIGVAAAVLMPVVAVAVSILSQVGIRAWCNQKEM